MDENNLNIMSDFSKLSDGEISWALEFYQRELNALMERVRHFEKQKALAESELDRRTILDYWQANPTLTRVNDGDKVLVTAESKSMGDSDPIGTVNTVKGEPFKFHNELGFMVHLDGSWGDVFREIGVVSRMRAAYLERELKGATSQPPLSP